jgi:23S rRNA (guanosine2251-2'-O)-methyltransferase
MSEYIFGRNSVIEALKAGRTINKIMMAKGSQTGSIVEIQHLAKESKIPLQEVERIYLNKLVEGENHQGVIALASPKDYVEWEEILEIAREKGEEPFVIILDEIEDPHNFGSIMRTADAVGAHGIIIPKRRAVGLTAAVSKSSAGAIEYVPVARVTNIAATIEDLKKAGLWIAGCDMDGKESLWESNLTGPLGLIIGGEGKGIGRLHKEKCDFLIKLPMWGNVSSLNASVAAALFMYEVRRQRIKGK